MLFRRILSVFISFNLVFTQAIIAADITTTSVTLNQDKIILKTQDLDYSNEAVETVPCEYKDEPMRIGFNARFLVEMLGVMDTENVIFKLEASNKAGLLLPESGENLMMLVMPVMMG